MLKLRSKQRWIGFSNRRFAVAKGDDSSPKAQLMWRHAVLFRATRLEVAFHCTRRYNTNKSAAPASVAATPSAVYSALALYTRKTAARAVATTKNKSPNRRGDRGFELLN